MFTQNNDQLYNQVSTWIKTNIHKLKLGIGLYMNCFDFNCEQVTEQLIKQIINQFHIDESIATKICDANINIIQQYVNTHQPKSFEDYIGMSIQQLTLNIQKERNN